MHIRPERCVDEEDPGVPIVAPPAVRDGCAGDGPADGGPLLLGVIMSLVSSSPSCLLELAILFWLLLMFDAGLKLLTYIGAPEVVESMVLVRLPPTAGRDIEANSLGVSGGENGFTTRCSRGGDIGGLGKGFSRLRLLVLRSCFFLRVRGDLSMPPEAESGDAAVDASPAWIFEGLLRPPDTDPHLLIPLRTPARKSPLSGEGRGSSSAAEDSEGVENLESNEPAGSSVSLSAMLNHCQGRPRTVYGHRLKTLPAATLHMKA